MTQERIEGSSIQGYSRKNTIINGDFSVWQRGDTVAAPGAYTTDRWKSAGAAGSTVSKILDHPSDSGHCAQFTNTGGADWHMNRIESKDALKLSGKEITISVYVKWVSGFANMGVYLYTADAVDNFSASTLAYTSDAIVPTATWTRYEFTTTLPTSGTGNGLEVRIVTTSGGATVVRVADVQLETGSVATEFEHRSIGEELALCQRYYHKHTESFMGCIRAANAMEATGIQFPVSMRAGASLTHPAASNFIVYGNGTAYGASALSWSSAFINSMNLGLTVTGPPLNSAVWVSLSGGNYIAVDAEL